MAFVRDRLQKIGGTSNGYLGAGFSVWSYKTDDAVGTVDGAGYFSEAADLLKINDLIIRATVTNIGASNEAWSTGGFHVVSASSISAGTHTIDVNNVLALTTIDSD